MPRIHVCSLARLHPTAAAIGARSLVTLASPGGGIGVIRPAGVEAARHLILEVSDITAPRPGHTQADETHIDQLLGAFRDWDRQHPLLLHCYAGVSRSTAAAVIGLCALAPHRSETDIATALRRASPTATPNPRMVALADAALARSGRLIAAVHAIGRGADCFEGAPFSLSIEGDD